MTANRARRQTRVRARVAAIAARVTLLVVALALVVPPPQPAVADDVPLGVWTPAAQPIVPAESATAVALPDGGIALIGANNLEKAPSLSLQLYDPARNEWALGPPPPSRPVPGTVLGLSASAQQCAHTCVLIETLSVPGQADAWYVYGTATGWAAAGRPNGPSRTRGLGAGAVALVDQPGCEPRCGHVLVVGGHSSFNGRDHPEEAYSVDLFDPTLRQWTAATDSNWSHRSARAVALADGTVLVTAFDRNEPPERYIPGMGDGGAWIDAGLPGDGRAHGADVAVRLTDGRVLVVAGDGTTMLYQQPPDHAGLGSWVPASPCLACAPYPGTGVLLPDGRVLVTSGHTDAGRRTDVADVYDAETDTWRQTGRMRYVRTEHGVALIGGTPAMCGDNCGKVLVAGGSGSAAQTAELYTPALELDGMAPVEGPSAGGTTVTITGAGLTGDATVHFGDSPAASVTWVSGTEITALSPPHAPGPATVTVTTPAGTASIPQQFTYLAPTVTGIDRSHGPATGGTPVTINGTGLQRTTEVRFGRIAVPASATADGTTVSVATPPADPGTVPVTLVTPETATDTASAPAFTYLPTLTGVQPDQGPTTGGQEVSISGKGLRTITGVMFGGTAASFTQSTDTDIVATTPPHAVGTVSVTVTVTTPGGQSLSSPNGEVSFTYVLVPAQDDEDEPDTGETGNENPGNAPADNEGQPADPAPPGQSGPAPQPQTQPAPQPQPQPQPQAQPQPQPQPQAQPEAGHAADPAGQSAPAVNSAPAQQPAPAPNQAPAPQSGTPASVGAPPVQAPAPAPNAPPASAPAPNLPPAAPANVAPGAGPVAGPGPAAPASAQGVVGGIGDGGADETSKGATRYTMVGRRDDVAAEAVFASAGVLLLFACLGAMSRSRRQAAPAWAGGGPRRRLRRR